MSNRPNSLKRPKSLFFLFINRPRPNLGWPKSTPPAQMIHQCLFCKFPDLETRHLNSFPLQLHLGKKLLGGFPHPFFSVHPKPPNPKTQNRNPQIEARLQLILTSITQFELLSLSQHCILHADVKEWER
ncbi:hypothetical protein Drorol1_Dr00012698 [Drosera rotundifolia]